MTFSTEALTTSVASLKKNLENGVLETSCKRKEKLKFLFDLLQDREQSIISAIRKDFPKPVNELHIEIIGASNQVVHAYKNVQNWMKPVSVSKPLVQFLDSAYYTHESRGVVYIVSTWNYPVLLALNPLIGAISAGNVVILRLPDVLPTFSSLFNQCIKEYKLDDIIQTYCVSNDEVFNSLRLISPDFVFFTGSTFTGKEVAKICAESLIPTVLELGGKCPCYVDDDFDITRAAGLICSARFFNSGQTCIAVDYVLCSENIRDKLVCEIRECLKKFYGEDFINNPDYGRIINSYHTRRLIDLLDKTQGKIVFGGHHDIESNYIEPTIVCLDSKNDSLMETEIFGPILPILTVSSEDEAISCIQSLSVPLTVMVFTDKSTVIDFFKKRTRSGSLVVNETMKHMTLCDLPFGGVGQSGSGRYHGIHSFESFSIKRSHFVKGPFLYSISDSLVYPPYSSEQIKKLVSFGKDSIQNHTKLCFVTALFVGCLGFLIKSFAPFM